MRLSTILLTSAAFFTLVAAGSSNTQSIKNSGGTNTEKTSQLADVQSTGKDQPKLLGLINTRSVDDKKKDGEVVVPEKEPVDTRVLKRAFLRRLLKAKRELDLTGTVVDSEMNANRLTGKAEKLLNENLQKAKDITDKLKTGGIHDNDRTEASGTNHGGTGHHSQPAPTGPAGPTGSTSPTGPTGPTDQTGQPGQPEQPEQPDQTDQTSTGSNLPHTRPDGTPVDDSPDIE
ncbi:hypothetical protein DFQ28_004304 [Apophysomyces sp. BC1034]|nr:hypothetical protein DFQ30_003876 [Apophysomyces sp. BC1015]KAG0178791.1 hypothetical protein DFQ29_003003 [Apophysomyces sp. BC1021]KAG0188838.1 hypothetical protein DFQ28_004304 [Apophysomyces sp. BC1034]